jgi:hypothetical protein
MKCDVDNAKEPCWCMQLPKATADIQAILTQLGSNAKPEGFQLASCLCQTCLAKRYSANIQTILNHCNISQLIELAKPYRQEPTLIEHIDYEIEGGYHVFSAWYHLKRGACCGNGCKNCPY